MPLTRFRLYRFKLYRFNPLWWRKSPNAASPATMGIRFPYA